MRLHKEITVVAAIVLLGGVACGGNNDTDNNNGDTPTQDMMPDGAMTADMDAPDIAPDMPPAIDLEIPEGCNPVAFEQDCLFPYPSNVFLTDDEQLPSGHRVELTDAARLKRRGEPIDFMKAHPADGFSHHQPIMATFAGAIDDEPLLFHDEDPQGSLSPQNITILLNADTGEPVSHWAEVERNTGRPEDRVLIIRPWDNLDHQTRYIVAIKELVDAEGAPIATPNGFAQLRDGTAAGEPTLAPLAQRYDADIFAPLADFGVAREELQLAWDFTTQSEEMVTRDLFAMREDLLARFEQSPPVVTVGNVIEDHNDQIALRLEGTIEVPLYLESDEPMAPLNRGADGRPEANGTLDVPFTLQVPYSAIPEAAGFEPARMMQYGHGFFGAREEINYSFMRNFSEEQSYITASVDWWGMRDDELMVLVQRLTSDPERALLFLDGVHQGMINFVALTEALHTSMTEVPELKRFDELLYDPDQIYYYGISQGHILGSGFLALSPHIERAVLSVGGAPFSLMMSRSNNFKLFLMLISSAFGGDISVQKFVTLCQHSFDRIDPSTYAKYVVEEPLPQTPPRRVLVQFGLWDHSVPSLTTFTLTNMMGIPYLEPLASPVGGLEAVEGPLSDEGSAAVIVDYMLEDPPGIYAQPPTNEQIMQVEDVLNVHEAVRRNPKIKAQIDTFLQPNGPIEQTCEGPCDPE